ncbi:MAG: alpha/beta hydrolase [Clostridiales bacterium]|nr:alpha/beta hydrolase [Clostridiales bacterium]
MAVDISEISFLQKGQGKDLLFLHGYLSSKEAFTLQINYFSKFYRVTALDFLGFGNSAPLKTPFSVSDYADWTEEVLQGLGVEKPHVIAHSFGCRVAVKMASRAEGIFDKILLTGPAGVILNRGLAYQCKVRAYRMVRKIAPKFAERKFGSKEYRSLSPIMKESYKKIVNEDLRADAKRIKNQVLIVQGSEDSVTPMKEAKAYLTCLQNGQMKEIKGGHFAFVQSPTAFNMTAEEFFL